MITLGDLEIQAYLPIPFPTVADFRLYWDLKTELLVKIGQSTFSDMSVNNANLLRTTTDT